MYRKRQATNNVDCHVYMVASQHSQDINSTMQCHGVSSTVGKMVSKFWFKNQQIKGNYCVLWIGIIPEAGKIWGWF